jgi:acyl dehydratase
VNTQSVNEIASVKQLVAGVGTEIDVGPWFELTQDLVDRFADLSGDHQWIHVDTKRAAASTFGGTIAHGNLLLALIPKLRGYRVTIPIRQGLNYGLDRLRFPAPLRVGSRIRLRTSILKADMVAPDQLHLVLRQTVEAEGSDKPVMVAEPITRYYLAEPVETINA